MPDFDPSNLFTDPVTAVGVVFVALVAIGLTMWTERAADARIKGRIEANKAQIKTNKEQIDQNEQKYQEILRQLTRINCRLDPECSTIKTHNRKAK